MIGFAKALTAAVLLTGDPSLKDIDRLPSKAVCLQFCNWNAAQQEKIRQTVLLGRHYNSTTSHKILKQHEQLQKLKDVWEAMYHAHWTEFGENFQRQRLALIRNYIGTDAYYTGIWPMPIFPELAEE